VVDAHLFGAASLQTIPPLVTWIYPPQEQQSEDCLTLNVWTPSQHDTLLPVIAWLHGGAFRTGATRMPLMNGRALVERGVVLVTVNYRLGALGLLAHPDLADPDTGKWANWQLQDMGAALHWVQQNITCFGGDPTHVCLMGQSGGAMSTAILAQHPAYRSCFQKAVLLSPPAVTAPVSMTPGDAAAYTELLVKPLEYLREYVEIVRAALWDGKVEHQGPFFTVMGTLPYTAPLPVLTSVLREQAFKLAGEISDGALSWLCPVPYLLHRGQPALRAGAELQGRPAPPLVAHVLAAMSEDRPAVIEATRGRIQSYGKLPFYAAMFADAGHPVDAQGAMSDALIESLVISGSPASIAERFKELLAAGLDELMVMHVPVQHEERELHQLMHLVGSLEA